MSVQCRKAYVSVNLDVDQEGVFHPRFIRWENGLVFQIDRILYKCRRIFQEGRRWRHPLHSADPWQRILFVSGGEQVVC